MLQAVKKELEASVTSLTQKCSDLEMHRSTLTIIYGIERKKVDSLRDQNSMLWGRALKAERTLSKLQADQRTMTASGPKETAENWWKRNGIQTRNGD